MEWLRSYPFLVLSLLLLVPGGVIWALRRDLRGVMGWMALASLPFALTEWLFYPDYWSPPFLWGLVEVLGFGVEDVLFVVGLGAFSSTAYAFAFQQRYTAEAVVWRGVAARGGGLLGGIFLGVAAVAWLGAPMIYGALVLMGLGVGVMVWRRPELGAPSVAGCVIVAAVYTGLCLVFEALLPGVFATYWHTEALFDRFTLGVPVEEVLYAGASGASATAFYPFVTGRRLASR